MILSIPTAAGDGAPPTDCGAEATAGGPLPGPFFRLQAPSTTPQRAGVQPSGQLGATSAFPVSRPIKLHAYLLRIFLKAPSPAFSPRLKPDGHPPGDSQARPWPHRSPRSEGHGLGQGSGPVPAPACHRSGLGVASVATVPWYALVPVSVFRNRCMVFM